MRSTVTAFPFDLFGGSGTAAGARLLADAVREIIDDTAKETRASRADCLRGKLRVRELEFETLDQGSDWRKRGRQAARQALKAGDFLLWLGGHHHAVRPELEGNPPKNPVVPFDAHRRADKFRDTTTGLS